MKQEKQDIGDMRRLSIPENIPLRWELWRGFGLPELIRSLILIGMASLGCWVYMQLSTSPLRILTSIMIVIAAGIIASGLFTKQNTRLSMYDYIKYAVQFRRTQHRYNDIKIEEAVMIEEEI